MAWGDTDKVVAKPTSWGAGDGPATKPRWKGGETPAADKALTDAKRRVKNTPDQMRAFNQGVTLGFADELDAAGAALETGTNNLVRRMTGRPSVGYDMKDAYHAVMQAENEGDARFLKEHPVQGIGLRVAGGLATPGMTAAGGYIARGGSAGARILRGGQVGLMTGAVAGAASTDGGVKDRAIGAGKGAAVGAVVGAGTGAVIEGAKTGVRMVNNLTGQRFMGPEAAAASRLRQALAADGVDEATITRAMQEYTDVGATSPTLADVAGENTRSLLRFAGSRPGAAKNNMQTYRDETVHGLPDAGIDRARGLTPNDARTAVDVRGAAQTRIDQASTIPGVEAGVGGQGVHRALNESFDQAKAGVDRAYSAARAASPEAAHLPAAEMPQMAANIREAVRDFHPDDIPSVAREMASLDRTSTPTVRDLFEMRQRLTSVRMSKPDQAAAAGRAIRAIDQEIESAAERGVIAGDPEVVGLWQTAIASRKEFGRQFEGDDLIAQLTERGLHGEGRTTMVAPEDASNKILGRTGLSQRPDLVRDLTRLRDRLGADSPQWASIRDEAAHRVLGRDVGTEDFGQAWSQFQAQSPDLARLIETPQMASRIASGRAEIGQAVGARTGVDLGERLLADGPDAFAAAVNGLTPDARQAAMVGARQKLTDALGQRSSAFGTLDQIAYAPNTRRNLIALFGEDEANRFIQAARLNLGRARNANFMAPNNGSKTFGSGEDAKGFMSIVNAVRDPLQALLSKVASGLTITDNEAAALVRAGLMNPQAALRATRPSMVSNVGHGVGGRITAAAPSAGVQMVNRAGAEAQ